MRAVNQEMTCRNMLRRSMSGMKCEPTTKPVIPPKCEGQETLVKEGQWKLGRGILEFALEFRSQQLSIHSSHILVTWFEINIVLKI